MERVQFQQEQMLAELKDLVEKKLFTQKETKQIMKKRTAFETALVRRVAKKADFLRYASYEMGLEQLRRKRVARMNLPPAPPTVSDYALVRRQFQIFERALKKFKSDVGLWIEYVQVAKREGARALVGRITARALQLHPNKPALYILAASHELSHLSPSAARTLLQRGIRLNSESVELWTEYVKMELGFVESLRRRWDVLGIADEKGKGKADPSIYIMGVGEAAEQEAPAVEETEGDEGAAARKEIMRGGIVKSVIDSAVQAQAKMEMFESLHGALRHYPSPPMLRDDMLAHVYDRLQAMMPDDPRAMKLLAGRHLGAELKGEDLIEGLKRANEEMMSKLGYGSREDVLEAYAEFVEQWCGTEIDVDLKRYLIASLQLVIQRAKNSPSLLSTHVRLLIGIGESPEKVSRVGAKYSKRAPKSARVWLAVLAAEKRVGSDEETKRRWREARGLAEGSDEDLEKVWTWGLTSGEGAVATHEGLLRESMRDASLGGVHERLLMRYVAEQASRGDAGDISLVRHVACAYRPTARVWAALFAAWAGMDGREAGLAAVHGQWQEADAGAAGLAWGEWLVRHGRGTEGRAAVAGGLQRLGAAAARAGLERDWTRAIKACA